MPEHIDLLDAHGAPTGITKEKRQAHRDGDLHRASHVWIVHEQNVLLQRRALAKESWPGMWDISVAGHVSAGESPIDAAIREAREELGLIIAPQELQFLGTLRYQVVVLEDYIENEIHEVYLLRRDVDVHSLTLDPLEVAEVRWVPHAELSRYDLVPHDDEYALLARSLHA